MNLKFWCKTVVPAARLDRFRMTAETRQLCWQAVELARQAGCPRLTTSFLLFALVEAGGDPQRLVPAVALRERLLAGDSPAYFGVKAAYEGWFRGSCKGAGAEGKPVMTRYIPQVLAYAELLAGGGEVTPAQLLAALLYFNPGRDEVEPGIQYILNMLQPGLEPIRREFGPHREEASDEG